MPLGPWQGGRSAGSPLRRAPLGASALNPDGGSFTAHDQVVAQPHGPQEARVSVTSYERQKSVFPDQQEPLFGHSSRDTQTHTAWDPRRDSRALTAALLRSAVWSPPPTPSSRPPPDAVGPLAQQQPDQRGCQAASGAGLCASGHLGGFTSDGEGADHTVTERTGQRTPRAVSTGAREGPLGVASPRAALSSRGALKENVGPKKVTGD